MGFLNYIIVRTFFSVNNLSKNDFTSEVEVPINVEINKKTNYLNKSSNTIETRYLTMMDMKE